MVPTMPDRIAVKRLTASDLTFFETQFRKLGVGNQKSINLNADIFVEGLYPALPGLSATLGDRIPISLTILGPDSASPYLLTRAVTKRDAYKNWRLNGEFVRDPEDQPGRFDSLVAGDLAVLEFVGDPTPQKLSLLLISASAAADSTVYASLNPLVTGGRKTMIEVSRTQLAAAAASSPSTHPIRTIASDPQFEAALEDAALGGAKGSEELAKKTTKPVSAATLALAKAAAEKNGREGEALAWVYLQHLEAEGKVTAIEWTSNANAVAPYDFSAVAGGKTIRIDAKSTTGEFERDIHMSVAELTVAASGEQYDLWRVYQLNDDGARLKIAKGIVSMAKNVLAGIALPGGVRVDSVSIDPGILSWSEEIVIERPDEGD
jgi:hypothetical protein